MKFPKIHFVDPTIPGVSAQDLQVHLVHGGGFGDTASDRGLRRDLSHLDGARLRDLGYDLSEGRRRGGRQGPKFHTGRRETPGTPQQVAA